MQFPGADAGTLIDAFVAAAAQFPATLIVVSSARRPAHSTLSETIAEGRIAGERLRALGVAVGDVVAVQLPAWREWMIACVAVAQAGAVLLPVVSIYGPREMAFVLRQSRARVLITPDHWRGADYAQVLAACGDLPDLRAHVVIGDTVCGTIRWEELLQTMELRPPPPRTADDLAMLIFTSGTTADPKGVRHTNRTLLAEIAAISDSRAAQQGREIMLSPWPPGHIAGACMMLRTLIAGVPIAAMDQWDPGAAAALIEQHRVTSSSGTPFHLTGILDAADREGRDLSSLVSYTVGAAPVPAALIARCSKRGLATLRSYGSTEHPTVTVGDPLDPPHKRLTTEGRTMPGNELRFVDDLGIDVVPGQDGEIVTRGPELFCGYVDATLDQAAFLPGGWYRTGDIGRLDSDGYLLITDRKKDIIIRGGENISSREVEDLLAAHPAVVEAAVVAAPDARMGEAVCAYVVVRPGATLSLDAIRTHFVAAGVARQKTPERLVLVDALPRNPTGKILKHELRTRARGLAA